MATFNYDAQYPAPWGEYAERPHDSEDIEYALEIILHRHRLLLAANGELIQIQRKKTSGNQCDNPNCGASQKIDKFALKADVSCPRCLGTGFIGGFDYIGEILARWPTAAQEIRFRPDGSAVVMQHSPWTMPDPKVFQFDILTALTRERQIEEFRETDEEFTRDVTVHADFDAFTNNNVIAIEKITDEPNKAAVKYVQGIDYVLSNNGVLWQSANRPGDMDNYYVSYRRTEWYVRRYRVTSVERPSWRGVITHQKFKVEELDRSEIIYTRLPVVEQWEQCYYNYPFPIDEWYSREL